MQRLSPKTKKTKFPRLTIIGFALLVVPTLFLGFNLGFFNVKKIEISAVGSLNCASNDQLENAYALSGQNLFLISESNIEKNIKQKYICVSKVNLSKLFPNEIKLEVFGREALGKLLTLNEEASGSANLESIATSSAQSTQDSFLVDNEVIFGKDIDQLLIPAIYVNNPNLAIGNKIDEFVKIGLDVLGKLKILGLKIEETQIIDQFFIVFPKTSQPKIIIRLDKDITLQIASLQLILEKAKIDSTELEFIDLRFDKPLIKAAPKKK